MGGSEGWKEVGKRKEERKTVARKTVGALWHVLKVFLIEWNIYISRAWISAWPRVPSACPGRLLWVRKWARAERAQDLVTARLWISEGEVEKRGPGPTAKGPTAPRQPAMAMPPANSNTVSDGTIFTRAYYHRSVTCGKRKISSTWRSRATEDRSRLTKSFYPLVALTFDDCSKPIRASIP